MKSNQTISNQTISNQLMAKWLAAAFALLAATSPIHGEVLQVELDVAGYLCGL